MSASNLCLVRSHRGTLTRLTSHDGWHNDGDVSRLNGEADGDGRPPDRGSLRKPALAKPQGLFGVPATWTVRGGASLEVSMSGVLTNQLLESRIYALMSPLYGQELRVYGSSRGSP